MSSLIVLRNIAETMNLLLPLDDFSKPEFVGPTYKNELFSDFPEEMYHKDLTAVARGDILAYLKSPAHFRARRQRTDEESDLDHLRFGRALHMLLLEPQRFKESFTLEPKFTGLKKDGTPSEKSGEAKQKREEWLKEQAALKRMVVTQEDMFNLFGMCLSISQSEVAMNLFTDAQFEMTGYFRDEETGLKCRTRIDLYNPRMKAVVDLKTCASANFRDFQSSCWKYRYDLQLAYYGHSLEMITKESLNHHAIIALEKTPPYGCEVYALDPTMIERGRKDFRKGVNGIAQSVLSNHWPCYTPQAKTMTLPRWASFEE